MGHWRLRDICYNYIKKKKKKKKEGGEGREGGEESRLKDTNSGIKAIVGGKVGIVGGPGGAWSAGSSDSLEVGGLPSREVHGAGGRRRDDGLVSLGM